MHKVRVSGSCLTKNQQSIIISIILLLLSLPGDSSEQCVISKRVLKSIEQ
jgi:hypothetical protein